MALRFRGSIEDQLRTANEAFVTDTPDILETQALAFSILENQFDRADPAFVKAGNHLEIFTMSRIERLEESTVSIKRARPEKKSPGKWT